MVLPVRITGLDQSGKPFSVLGHTLNFSRGGARLGGTEIPLEVGQMITVEYKRQKCKYIVRWVGHAKPTAGQAGIESLEPDRYIWIETPEQHYHDDIDPHRFRSRVNRPPALDLPNVVPPAPIPEPAAIPDSANENPPDAVPQLTAVPESAADHALRDLEQIIRSHNLSVDAALQSIAENACSWLHATGAAIALLEGDEMVCRAASGLAPALGLRFRPTDGLTGEAVRTRRPVFSQDTANDPRVDRDLWASISIRSVASIPILVEAAPAGVLEVFAANPNAFGTHQAVLLDQLAALARSFVAEGRESRSTTRS